MKALFVTPMVALFGLVAPVDGAVWLFSGLVLLLLLALWLRTVAASQIPAAAFPARWLYLPLALLTLLAVLLAAALPALLLAWSLLLLSWTAVALAALGPAYTWRASGWLWSPLGAWGVAVAAAPLPEPLYAQASTLPLMVQLILAVGLLLPLVCWPLWGWRLLTTTLSRQTAVLLLVWPALAAAGLLGRFLLAVGLNFSLLLPVILLAGLCIGLPWLWPRLNAAALARLAQLGAAGSRQGRRLYQAVYDALLLLEGEAGLLWLLGLLVLALLFN
jgi:hypothetical protein